MKKFVILIAVIGLISSCKQGLTGQEKTTYITKGKEIAQATFKKMGGEVTKMMQEGGVAKAMPYCNAKAISLTQSMAKQYGVHIKRTSDKLRNTDNKADEEEAKVIEDYKALIAQSKKPHAIVTKDKKGHPHFYAPIIIQKKCLTCHGEIGKTLKRESDSIIKVLYPSDKAVGFKEGDLRGIWSITFDDK